MKENASSGTEVMMVEGMTCSNCAAGISRVLGTKGLQQVYADFSSGEVSYQNPESVSYDEIRQTIESLGYKVNQEQQQAHGESSSLSAVEKKFLFSLLFTLPLFLHMFFPHDAFINNPWLQLGLALPVYVTGVMHFGRSAWGSLKSGIANMDVLIFTGSSAAFFYSLAGTLLYAGSAEAHNYLFYETAATIITLVLLGNLLEHRSVNQTTSAIRELTALQPNMAQKIVGSEIMEVPLADVKAGDLLRVNEGDRIPLDSLVIKGDASIDESMITGESQPVFRSVGQEVVGGTIVTNGNLEIKVIRTGNQTILSQIIDLVKQAQRDKPKIQQLGDRVSAIFVPVVLVISLITFLIWYLFLDATLAKAIMTSVSVLVISCPCAMGLATPTAVMSGLGRAAKNGILVKGGSTLQELASIRKMVFDKTGTLTTGNFSITGITTYNSTAENELPALLKGLEQHSSHPIARAVTRAWPEITPHQFARVEETRGLSVSGYDDQGNYYQLGSAGLLKGNTKHETQHSLYLLKNGELIAGVNLADEVKAGTRRMVNALKSSGIKPVMLSGDREGKCSEVAAETGIEEYYCEKRPQEKLELIETWNSMEPVAMVGDGINDAPALARATAGISLGNASQIAIQSAQVIILNGNDPGKITEAVATGKHTLLTIKQNLFWAFFYNVIAIPVAAAGLLNPMIAALAMAASDVIVIGNSIRLKYKKF